MTAQHPAAVLWDMDGTIVDTEPLWIEAQRGLLDDFGLPQFDETGEEALVGANLEFTAELFIRHGVPLTAREITDRITTRVIASLRGELDWRPGAVELLADLCAAGIPLALVTNSPREMAAIVIEQLPADTFGTIVGAEDVTLGKPHPQPYLLAATRLGVDPTACIVLEDSPHGLRSGEAAGMTTVGIPHAASLDEAGAHVLLDSLTGIDTRELVRRCARGESS